MIGSRWKAALVGIPLAIACATHTLADQQTHPTGATAQTMSSPKDDCEALMNSVLPFAKQMLDRHGEFYPYGGAMRADGQIIPMASYEGQEHPQASEVIKGLKHIFIAGARDGQFKATALVYDVRVTLPSTGAKSDAVAVSLNHRDHYSIIVFFPYRIESGSAVFGTAFAQKGEADIFPAK